MSKRQKRNRPKVINLQGIREQRRQEDIDRLRWEICSLAMEILEDRDLQDKEKLQFAVTTLGLMAAIIIGTCSKSEESVQHNINAFTQTLHKLAIDQYNEMCVAKSKSGSTQK